MPSEKHLIVQLYHVDIDEPYVSECLYYFIMCWTINCLRVTPFHVIDTS